MKKFQHIADGRAQDSPKNLNEVMGVRVEEIGGKSAEDFEQSLKKMSMTEMQALAVEMGVRPLPDRPRLQKVLATRHKKLNRSYGGAYENQSRPTGKSADQAKEFLGKFK